MTFQELIFVYPFLIVIFGLICFAVFEYDRMNMEEQKRRQETKEQRFAVGGASRREMNIALRQAFKADRARARRIQAEEQHRRAGYHRPQRYEFF